MSTRRSSLLGLGFMLALVGVPASTLFAQAKTPAIDGYDPVAYFIDKRPIQGQSTISYDWDDKRYLFASTKHRDLFAGDPDRYEPQFNGMCAGNVSRGNKVKADPTVWRVVDGKLYLFAKQPSNDEAVARAVVVAQAKWKDLK